MLRSILVGVNDGEGDIRVVNLLRTTVVRKSDIQSIELASCGVGAIQRLMFHSQSGGRYLATGVSIWIWPLVLPIHKPGPYRERVERFLLEAGLGPVFVKNW